MGYTQEITRPYLLVKGDFSTGDYRVVEYATEKEAREKQIKDKGLAKILKAFPIKQIRIEDANDMSEQRRIEDVKNMSEKQIKDKYKLKSAVGCAVYRAIGKEHGLSTILSEDDVFLGSNIKTSLVNAMKRKKKYTTNLNGEKKPVYGMFRDDQIIISALVHIKKTKSVLNLRRIIKPNIKKYYLDGITKDEIQKLEDTLLLPEQTIIREAYYGKSFFDKNKSGLNLLIDYKDKFVDGIRLDKLLIAYTKKKDIDGIMNELNADKVEDLFDKPILAYRIKSEELGKKADCYFSIS